MHSVRPLKKALTFLSISFLIRWERINSTNGCLDKRRFSEGTWEKKENSYCSPKIGGYGKNKK
jgi:hypothetical protein